MWLHAHAPPSATHASGHCMTGIRLRLHFTLQSRMVQTVRCQRRHWYPRQRYVIISAQVDILRMERRH